MLYLQILKFSFLRFFAYPSDILIRIIRHIIEIFFLIFFWTIFAKSGGYQNGLQYFASYFLIATGVSTLVMAQWGEFEGYIGRSVKMGHMNNYLLRPYGTLRYLHAMAVGARGIDLLLAIIYIIVGLLIQPIPNMVSFLYFSIFLATAYIISFAMNIITGTIYFHIPEANGILNSINHTKWILSGLLVPIFLFPEPFKTIVLASPFPWLVFGPINVLKNNPSVNEVVFNFLIAILWCVILNIIAYKFWKESTKKYEAIGI